jgi:hypothetical protein
MPPKGPGAVKCHSLDDGVLGQQGQNPIHGLLREAGNAGKGYRARHRHRV